MTHLFVANIVDHISDYPLPGGGGLTAHMVLMTMVLLGNLVTVRPILSIIILVHLLSNESDHGVSFSIKE